MIYCVCFALLGLNLASTGPILLDLLARCGADLSAAGILFSSRSFGYVVGSLAAGPIGKYCSFIVRNISTCFGQSIDKSKTAIVSLPLACWQTACSLLCYRLSEHYFWLVFVTQPSVSQWDLWIVLPTLCYCMRLPVELICELILIYKHCTHRLLSERSSRRCWCTSPPTISAPLTPHSGPLLRALRQQRGSHTGYRVHCAEGQTMTSMWTPVSTAQKMIDLLFRHRRVRQQCITSS